MSSQQANRRLGEEEAYFFHYSDLERCTGKTNEAIRQNVSRGKLDPNKLESVAVWIARHAHDELRKQILQYALEARPPENPAVGKKRRS